MSDQDERAQPANPERDDTAIEPEPEKQPEPPMGPRPAVADPSPPSDADATPEPEPEKQPEPSDQPVPEDTGIKKETPKPRPRKAAAKKSAPKKPPAEKAKAKDKPEPAKAKAKTNGGAAKPKSAELLLAHKATALATGGSVSKDGVLTKGERVFGAPVNAGQVELVRDAVKGKPIMEQLGCKETELKAYATGDIKVSDLPEKAKAFLKELNGKFDSKAKMWPRKDAAILYVLQQERKKRGGGSKVKKPEPEKAAA